MTGWDLAARKVNLSLQITEDSVCDSGVCQIQVQRAM